MLLTPSGFTPSPARQPKRLNPLLALTWYSCRLSIVTPSRGIMSQHSSGTTLLYRALLNSEAQRQLYLSNPTPDFDCCHPVPLIYCDSPLPSVKTAPAHVNTRMRERGTPVSARPARAKGTSHVPCVHPRLIRIEYKCYDLSPICLSSFLAFAPNTTIQICSYS